MNDVQHAEEPVRGREREAKVTKAPVDCTAPSGDPGRRTIPRSPLFLCS